MDEQSTIELPGKTALEEERMAEVYVVLAVWGMRGPSCAIRVRQSLVLLDGVIEAYVDYLVGMAEVLFDPMAVNVQELIEAVTRAGGDERYEYGARIAIEGA